MSCHMGIWMRVGTALYIIGLSTRWNCSTIHTRLLYTWRYKVSSTHCMDWLAPELVWTLRRTEHICSYQELHPGKCHAVQHNPATILTKLLLRPHMH